MIKEVIFNQSWVISFLLNNKNSYFPHIFSYAISCVVWENALKPICIDFLFCFAFARFTQNTVDQVNSFPIFYLHTNSNLKQNLNKQAAGTKIRVHFNRQRKKNYIKIQNRNIIPYSCVSTQWQSSMNENQLETPGLSSPRRLPSSLPNKRSVFFFFFHV